MILKTLFANSNLEINNLENIGDLNSLVCGITDSSKLVTNNYVFVAITGKTTDGHYFVKEALDKGAIRACIQKDKYDLVVPYLSADDTKKLILVDDTNSLLIKLCNVFYHDLPHNIIAVTGTNGKTSVNAMVEQILRHLGNNVVRIGSLGTYFNGIAQHLQHGLTTPVTAELFHLLSIAKQQNINYAVLEASSEGLAQNRLKLLPVNIAAFTNLTPEHLNFHVTMENYFNSKCMLFLDILSPEGIAIINADDPYGKRLIQLCKQRGIKVLTYGKEGEDLRLISITLEAREYNIVFSYNNHTYSSRFAILGEFQVYNLLCALLIVLSSNCNVEITSIFDTIPYLQAAPGRLECIRKFRGAKIFIDYAHTPDALYRVLQTLRELTSNKLYVVFGCGGNRDRSKREQMGRIAHQLADYSFITDDNPRDEDPVMIREEIIQGFDNGLNFKSIGDRAEAITAAMATLKEGDLLLVTGKGCEETQIVKNTTIPFSDKKVIESIQE